MPLYANNLLDEITSRPIEGAHVYVYTLDGATEASIQDELGAAVTQPLVTGADGDYAFQAPTGLYQLVFWKNARRIYRDRAVQVGTGPVLPADVLTALGGVDGASYVGTTDGDTVQEHIDAIEDRLDDVEISVVTAIESANAAADAAAAAEQAVAGILNSDALTYYQDVVADEVAAASAGAYWITEKEYLFQDDAGTTPVTAQARRSNA
jgi:hypothetical protein